MYYLCLHDKRNNTKDYWADFTAHRVYLAYSYITILLIRN